MNAIGALGAALLVPFTLLLLLCFLGAVERRRWNGNVPTIHEYMFEGKRRKRSSTVQLQLARFGPRVLVTAVVGVVIGGLLMTIGAALR